MIRVEGLDRLVADLLAAPGKVQRGAWPALEKEAERTKNDARSFAPGGPMLPAYADSITHDVRHAGSGVLEAEIGPDKGLAQGPLGNLLEYGSVKNAPLSHLGPALDLAGPRLEQAIGNVDDGL